MPLNHWHVPLQLLACVIRLLAHAAKVLACATRLLAHASKLLARPLDELSHATETTIGGDRELEGGWQKT